MNKVIAILVTFNRLNLLKIALESVLDQSHPLKKIIVVDNNSSDGTKAYVEGIANEFCNVEYFNTGGNLGGAGGFKAGFELALNYDFDYIWLMDDDLAPMPECLQHLLDSNGDIRQPVRYNIDGSCAELSPLDYDLTNPFVLRPSRKKVLDVFPFEMDELEIAGVPFEGPLISRDVVESVGLPDEKFFIFYDDLDYSIRSRKMGYSIRCIKSAHAQRLLVNNQKNDIDGWKGYYMIRNYFHINYKHGDNFLVKSKPFFIWLALLFVSIFKFKKFKKLFPTYLDSFSLKNSDKNRP